MLRTFRLRNFKSIKDTGEIQLGGITILVGPNSSGKSSVIQALLAGRQTARIPTEGALVLADDHGFNLGSFPEVARKGVTPQLITIEFGIETIFHPRFYAPNMPPSLLRARGSTIVAWFQSQIGYLNKTRQTYSRLVSIAADSARRPASVPELDFPKTRITGTSIRPGSNRFKWTTPNPDGTTADITHKNEDSRFFAVPEVYELFRPDRAMLMGNKKYPPAANHYVVAGSIASALEEDLKAIRHVGAMRAVPQRAYALKGTRPQEVGDQGERAPDIILAETRRKKSSIKLMTGLNRALEKVGISTTIRAKIPSGANAFSILLEHMKPRVSGVNLASVGFGVSQILPILVEAIHAEPHSIILLEQPEIHLQPSAQSRIADILTGIATEQRKRFLVETHSEHFIRRLQVLVAQGRIPPSDVRIYYFQPGDDGTTVVPMQVKEDGRLDREWPDGFFDESIRISMDHLTALGGDVSVPPEEPKRKD